MPLIMVIMCAIHLVTKKISIYITVNQERIKWVSKLGCDYRLAKHTVEYNPMLTRIMNAIWKEK